MHCIYTQGLNFYVCIYASHIEVRCRNAKRKNPMYHRQRRWRWCWWKDDGSFLLLYFDIGTYVSFCVWYVETRKSILYRFILYVFLACSLLILFQMGNYYKPIRETRQQQYKNSTLFTHHIFVIFFLFVLFEILVFIQVNCVYVTARNACNLKLFCIFFWILLLLAFFSLLCTKRKFRTCFSFQKHSHKDELDYSHNRKRKWYNKTMQNSIDIEYEGDQQIHNRGSKWA